MSNEAMTGIIVSVAGIIVSIAGFLIYSKKSNIKISQKNKTGNNTISNSTIGNEINKPKK